MRHSTFQVDQKAQELETAKDILAEIFRIGISDVDEMIQNRFEDISSKRRWSVAAGILAWRMRLSAVLVIARG